MYEIRAFVDDYGQEWFEYSLFHSDHFRGISDYEEEGWYWDCLLASGGPFHTKEDAIFDANGYTPYIVEYEIERTREDIAESLNNENLGY